jgi:hypothetical protein
MKNNHQAGLDILNFKILFTSIFNMFFDFITIMFMNHMFKVGFNRNQFLDFPTFKLMV